MRLLRLGFPAVLVATVCIALPGGAQAASTPSPSCNGGGCGGWFRSNVTVSWSYDKNGVTGTSGCGASSVTNDTSGATFKCEVSYGAEGRSYSVTVRKDSTPPSVTGSLARGPDANGWYTSPVAAAFKGDDGASGVSSCTSGTYGGPDGAAVAVTGSCTDGAGNVGSTTLTIKYDSTPPTVTPAADRPPDSEGWYNHPVTVAFTGQDTGSGVAECTPPVTYKGPDANPAKFVGQCRDAAGHLSSPVTGEVRYDGTKPARPTVRATRASTFVSLSWKAPADAVRSEIVRSPGRTGKKPAIVFAGKKRQLVDRKTRPDVRYWYQVRLYDEAGNVSSTTVSVRPGRGDPLARPACRGAATAARDVVGREEGALLQRPALAQGSEAPDDLAPLDAAPARVQLDVRGEDHHPRRRRVPTARLAGARDDRRPPLRQARGARRLRRQAAVRGGACSFARSCLTRRRTSASS